MAHKKIDGSTCNDRNSETKRLSTKRFGGESILVGSIIVRQHDTKFHADTGVDCGCDYTLSARTDGKVRFEVRGPKNHEFISIRAK